MADNKDRVDLVGVVVDPPVETRLAGNPNGVFRRGKKGSTTVRLISSKIRW